MAQLSNSSSKAAQLGWIGLGSMGLAMAMNLQKHLVNVGLPALQYHNRTMSRGAPLQQLGGKPSTLESLVTNCDIIFLSLADDSALDQITHAILDLDHAYLNGKIFVDTSTVHPSSTTNASIQFTKLSAQFLAAPVFGSSPVATEGRLLFILAGPESAVEATTPYLTGVMGRGIIRLGNNPKQATMLKTTGNFITAAMMEVIAEAHVLIEQAGLPSEALETLIDQQYGPLALNMSKRLTSGAYYPPRQERPWSDLKLAIKDVSHGIECAKEYATRLEVAEVALGHLKKADRFGESKDRALDSSSLYGVLRQEAGLSFETDLVKKRDAQ